MEIESLIDSANEELYHRVRAHVHVKLEENQDWRAEVWTSKISGDTAVITHCPTSFPEAAFAHELLCIDTQLKGFKRILGGISLNEQVQGQIQTIIATLNHSFQQHKIAKEFLSMGYLPEQIYGNEGDSEATFLEDQLNEEGRSLTALSLLYMLFIDPFMPFTAEEKQSIKRRFEAYEGGRFSQNFERMEEILDGWRNGESYEAERYMIDFLLNAGLTDSWFSYQPDSPEMYEKEFPTYGFFVDNRFTYEEIVKVYG